MIRANRSSLSRSLCPWRFQLGPGDRGWEKGGGGAERLICWHLRQQQGLWTSWKQLFPLRGQGAVGQSLSCEGMSLPHQPHQPPSAPISPISSQKRHGLTWKQMAPWKPPCFHLSGCRLAAPFYSTLPFLALLNRLGMNSSLHNFHISELNVTFTVWLQQFFSSKVNVSVRWSLHQCVSSPVSPKCCRRLPTKTSRRDHITPRLVSLHWMC